MQSAAFFGVDGGEDAEDRSWVEERVVCVGSERGGAANDRRAESAAKVDDGEDRERG